MSNQGFRFNGEINIPTVLAVAAACIGLSTAVAVAQTTAAEALSKTEKYESVPAQLAHLETLAQTQADDIRDIKTELRNRK